MHVFLWFVAFCCAGLSAVATPLIFLFAQSAPQEAVVVSVGIGVAVVPYCLARARDEMTEYRHPVETRDETVELNRPKPKSARAVPTDGDGRYVIE